MAARDIIDIFDDCTRRMAAGQSLEECLSLYPNEATRLRLLLEATEQVRALPIAQPELLEDREAVWAKIEQQLPVDGGSGGRGVTPPYWLFSIVVLFFGLLLVIWLARPDLLPFTANGQEATVPIAASLTPTPTIEVTNTVTASPTHTQTPNMTMTITVLVTATETTTETATSSPTATSTAIHTATSSPTATETTIPSSTPTPTITSTPSPTATATPTFVPGCGVPLTAQDASEHVLQIYPNTTITSIEQVTKFDGVLVWEVQTSHGIEINIDVGCGTILTIERTDRNEGSLREDDNSDTDSGNNDDSSSGGEENSVGNNDNSNSSNNNNDNDDDDNRNDDDDDNRNDDDDD